jgi:hypothetical protein
VEKLAHMKIEKVTFSKSEQDEIYNKLIQKFDVDTANGRGHKIEAEIYFDDILVVFPCFLTINSNYYEEGDNITSQRYLALISRNVGSFQCIAMIDGEEVETNLYLDDRISQYYEY